MEITNNSNLVPFLNKKVRVVTEINSVFIGKLYFVDKKKNFKLSNCREFITRFGVYRYNGFFKNVNFNGGKKMTIDFDFNYPPLTTENSTISSMVYSGQYPISKSFEKIQGYRKIKPAEIVPPRVTEPDAGPMCYDLEQSIDQGKQRRRDVVLPRLTRESNAGPMFYNPEESKSSQRNDQETFLPDVARPPNPGSMLNDPEDPTSKRNQRSGHSEIFLRGATKRSNGRPVFYASKTSNLQGNQRVETLEKSDLGKPGTSQRIISGNQRIAPPKSFPYHVRRELVAKSMICYSEPQISFQGNQRIEPPETITSHVTNRSNVKSMLYNSEGINISKRIIPENQRVEQPRVSIHDVTNEIGSRSMFYNNYERSSNKGNQNLKSQDIIVSDATKRMEALSTICNSEMPSTSQRDIQENARLRGGEENIKPDEERSLVPYNRLPAAQNLPVFPNIEGQNFGNEGSYNFSTHALICVPIILKMEFRLSN